MHNVCDGRMGCAGDVPDERVGVFGLWRTIDLESELLRVQVSDAEI
jgi:hypothetical protein